MCQIRRVQQSILRCLAYTGPNTSYHQLGPVPLGTSRYLQDRLQSVLKCRCSARLLSPGVRTLNTIQCFGNCTGYTSLSESSSGRVFWRTIVCTAEHRRMARQPAADIRGCCSSLSIRSYQFPTMLMPSTCRSMLGDRTLHVAASCVEHLMDGCCVV